MGQWFWEFQTDAVIIRADVSHCSVWDRDCLGRFRLARPVRQPNKSMVRDVHHPYRLLDSWNRRSSRRLTFGVLGAFHVCKWQHDAPDVLGFYASLPDSKSMAVSASFNRRLRFRRRVLASVFDDAVDYA
jgi:hypothetical protein